MGAKLACTFPSAFTSCSLEGRSSATANVLHVPRCFFSDLPFAFQWVTIT